ncbi:MAG: hypothetical protein WCC90_04705 [Methylocella sp.]
MRGLGANRAGEIKITRFSRNKAVRIGEMIETAGARNLTRVAGRHVLAIQDTTTAPLNGSKGPGRGRRSATKWETAGDGV